MAYSRGTGIKMACDFGNENSVTVFFNGAHLTDVFYFVIRCHRNILKIDQYAWEQRDPTAAGSASSGSKGGKRELRGNS